MGGYARTQYCEAKGIDYQRDHWDETWYPCPSVSTINLYYADIIHKVRPIVRQHIGVEPYLGDLVTATVHGDSSTAAIATPIITPNKKTLFETKSKNSIRDHT